MKHDLDGDGMIIKTIHNKGVGYDRPFDFDEMTLDLKVYQYLSDDEFKIYADHKDFQVVMTDKEHISLTLKKIL